MVPHGVTVPCLTTLDAGRIREHRASGRFFWIDLTDPSAAEVHQLGEIFGFHPLALEDTAYFGQRPKLDDYGDYGFLVFYGAVEQRHDDVDLLREVHLFVSGQYIVSVHREPLPALDEERSRLKRELVDSEQVVLYRIVDSLTDTFFPLLAAIGDEIDTLEEAVINSPTHQQLQRLSALKRQLVSLRKVVTPQRDGSRPPGPSGDSAWAASSPPAPASWSSSGEKAGRDHRVGPAGRDRLPPLEASTEPQRIP